MKELLLVGLAAVSLHAEISVASLTCEHALNPLGLESVHPRLSWKLSSSHQGQKQTAYQVVAASSVQLLESSPDLWDTGRVSSDQSVLVRYAGKPLASRQRVYWRVRVWDRSGRPSAYSDPAHWEMGLLNPSDWKAEWIGYPAGWSGRALYFRVDAKLDKPVDRARAYVAGVGYYELHVNGTRIGDDVLQPATTDFAKRVLYSTYDIGSALRSGNNTFAAIVGNGWYGMPKLLLQVEVSYRDGTLTTIPTYGFQVGKPLLWRVTSGPVTANSIYDGEVYDATLEKPGWDLPDVTLPAGPDRTEAWENAVPVEPPGGKLIAQLLEPVRVVQTMTPRSVTEPMPGIFVFDTGQNVAGWAELRVAGSRGTRVTLRFAESLNADGTVNQENLRKAAATDVYILKGGGPEKWEPRFTYHGFRYVQVEGFPGRPTPHALPIKVVRSSVAPNGKFESSSELLNRIQQMVWWTEASNLTGIPTDCPQRDERMGWLNDLTVRIEESLYNFTLPRFYSKFLKDVSDTQAPDGTITDTVPFKWGSRPADPVSASYLLLGWQLYQHYGDIEPLANHYDGFRRWVNFLESKSLNYVVHYGWYGDWSPPIAFGTPGSIGSGALSKDTPLPLMSTGYLYYCARLLSEMAGILDKTADRQRYALLAQRTADAFNREFWNEKTGGYGANNQAANSFALFLGLVPTQHIPAVAANLASDVEKRGYHLTTGNLCTKYLLEMLTEHGYADTALRVAQQDTYPSWGFMLKNGATTLWERWEHMTGGKMNSHNHPMMGSVSSWIFKYLAGILPDPQAPGFRRIIIRPYAVHGLEHVKAEYESPYGTIRSSWLRQGGSLRLTVTVPVNSTATVYVPGNAISAGLTPLRTDNGATVFEVPSGTYQFIAR